MHRLATPSRWWQVSYWLVYGASWLVVLTLGAYVPAGYLRLFVKLILAMVAVLGVGISRYVLSDDVRTGWRRLFQQFLLWLIIIINLYIILAANALALSALNQHQLVSGWLIIGSWFVTLVLLLPQNQVLVTQLRGTLARIIFLAVVYFQFLLGLTALVWPTFSTAPTLLRQFAHSGLGGGLVFILLVGLVARAWGLGAPLLWGGRVTWRQAWPIVGYGLAFIWFNAFSAATSWSTLNRWSYHFATFKWSYVFSGLEAGLAEEWLYRYAILGLLLYVWAARRHGIVASILVSGLLFGIWHVSNILAGQNVWATVNQMVFAAASGCFLAAAYLFFGSLPVVMLFHTALDTTAFMVSGSLIAGGAPTSFDWFVTVGIVLTMLLATGYMVTGARGATVKAHVRQRWSLSSWNSSF